MTALALDKTLTAAVVAIVLGTLAGVLTAETQPGAALAGAVWVPPVVAGDHGHRGAHPPAVQRAGVTA